jgi:hypothetical protein
MEKLMKNAPRVHELRKTMHDDADIHVKIRAFVGLYMLAEGDPHYQRRLVLEFENAAKVVQVA